MIKSGGKRHNSVTAEFRRGPARPRCRPHLLAALTNCLPSQRPSDPASGLFGTAVPTDQVLHDLLEAHTVAQAQQLQIGLGKLRRASGHFPGQVLALDPHRLVSCSQRDMVQRRPSAAEPATKQAQIFFLLDAHTRQPLCLTNVIGLVTAGTLHAGDALKSLTNSSGAQSSKMLGWGVTAQSRTNVPEAHGHISVRLKPENVSVKGRFLFLVDRVTTNGAVRFSVTVAPNASFRPPRVAAHLMLSDGAGMMARKELKDLHGSGDAFRYEFQAAPSLLANSRFVLQDLGKGGAEDQNNGDSFWFYLGDFIGHDASR